MLTEPATSRLEGTPWGLESCTQRLPAGTWDGLRGTMCPEEKAGPQASGAEALGCSVTVSRGGMNGTGEFLIDLKAQALPNAWAYPKKGRVRGQGLVDHTGSCDSLSRSTQGCHGFTFQKESRKDWDWGKANLTSQGHPWLHRELEASLGLHRKMDANKSRCNLWNVKLPWPGRGEEGAMDRPREESSA